MFKFVETRSVWWPVKVIEPDPERPGFLVEQEFQVLLEIPDAEVLAARKAERERLIRNVVDAKGDEAMVAAQAELDKHEDELGQKVVKNWRDIADKDGVELPFSMFPRVYREERVKVGVARAYIDAISQDKARLGN